MVREGPRTSENNDGIANFSEFGASKLVVEGVMKRSALVLTSILLISFFGVLYNESAEATLKYKKDTGKKCTFCHTGIPEPGDEDPQLNEDGKAFEKNGYELTEEQKRRP
jgi:hypothetical protein